MTRRIMHIDLDTFFVSVERVGYPELKGKPVVVGGRLDQRGVVAAASYEARAYGLYSGMPLVTAARLCPQTIFIEGSFHRYREASENFHEILADFSPLLEPMGLDEAYLDATGFESMHGSARNMALKIKQRVKDKLGICASIGIARSKIVAKIASGLSKPDGLLEVPEGKETSFLNSLAVSSLPGVGKKTAPILLNLGIKTIGDLASFPVSELKSRFGVYGETLHGHACGIDHSEVKPPGEAKSISHETTFDHDTREIKRIEATLRYLAERVGANLRRKGRQAKRVTLKLRYADFTTITRQETLSQATDADQFIFNTGHRLLERELKTGHQAIRLIGIGVSKLVEIGRQVNMLDSTQQRMDKLNTAIDRIRKKYGFTAIQTGRTLLLKDIFPTDERRDYSRHTPSLPR
ncbi:DNA polymerase IV [Chloroflexota bacterium]